MHQGIRALREDPLLKKALPGDTAQLLSAVSKQLGEDWAITIK